MKLVGKVVGWASILLGLAQWSWVSWAYGASQHLGSPIRVYGDLANALFEGNQHKSIIDVLQKVGLLVSHVLSYALLLLLLNGFLLVVMGTVLLSSKKTRKQQMPS